MQLSLLEPVFEAIVDAAAERATERVLEQIAGQLSLATTSPWLTAKEAAAFLRCKEQRILDLRSSGRLTPHKEGGRALVSRAELEALVEVEDARRRRAA